MKAHDVVTKFLYAKCLTQLWMSISTFKVAERVPEIQSQARLFSLNYGII